ncbi:SPT2-like protein [Pyrus ussuriensis x Pyrus communis]|uniref:SPT2-like protein n=1 Tax=Pyrus ussuriensis x Pyrus communis TaxID=2448454 RepID=A0A5N5HJ63_9ROSA|nr:SPT2-like protein [Pyrus ussuriensis x Pyrus communis]
MPKEVQRKYYVVDSDYANMSRFLAPYHKVRYHLRDFRGRGLEGRGIRIALLVSPHSLSLISEASRFSIGVVLERNFMYFAFVIVQFEREMQGYDKDDYGQLGDEYEDYEDDQDDEVYEEEEEDPKPTKEALAYLELRQRLKAQLRKKKSGSCLANSSNKKKNLPFDQ